MIGKWPDGELRRERRPARGLAPPPVAGLRSDGDGDDLIEFPGCTSDPWQAPRFTMPYRGCPDDFDADVDLKDFAAFQRAFGGSTGRS